MAIKIILVLCVIIGICLPICRTQAENPCSSNEIPCDDGDCIERGRWCDSSVDCDDESDEQYCKQSLWYKPVYDPNSCKDTHHLCTNGRCFPKSTKCDGFSDCYDGSDEENCETDEKTSSEEITTIKKDSSEEDSTSEEDSSEEKETQSTTKQSRTGSSSSVTTTTDSVTKSFDSTIIQTESATTASDSAIEVDNALTSTDTLETPQSKSDNYLKTLKTDLPSTGTFPGAPATTTSQHFLTRHPHPIHNSRRYRPGSIHEAQHSQHTSKTSPENNILTRPYLNYLSPVPRSPERSHTKYSGVPSRTLYPFIFERNYSSSMNKDSILKAKNWILNQRDHHGGWGKDTPRALIALSLVNNSFNIGLHEEDLMRKYLQVYVGIGVFQSQATTNPNRLSHFILALLATCNNPSNFFGTDLTELLKTRIQSVRNPNRFVNPIVHLSLCLAGRDLSYIDVQILMKLALNTKQMDEQTKDMQYIAITALACKMASSATYNAALMNAINSATTNVLRRKLENGSFGSKYSTALATQALISANSDWDYELTSQFLKMNQLADGSFGDLLSTYLALPALAGRSLLHLRNTKCTGKNESKPSEVREYSGPKVHVHYSLNFGHPVTNSYSVRILVPQGINFLDVMRLAEHQNSQFRFSYEERNGLIKVYSIAGIPNDSEQGYFWNLYLKQSGGLSAFVLSPYEKYVRDLRQLYPQPGQHVVFWYHSSPY